MFHIKIVKPFKDVVLFEQETAFRDHRGSFTEIYREGAFKDFIGNCKFVQENESVSKRGVLRGLHYQNPKSQGKLVRVSGGYVYDFVVDLRESSPTFGKNAVIEIDKPSKSLWIPPGFAHGFYVVSDWAVFNYKVTDYYDPGAEHCLLWTDSGVDFSFVDSKFILSDKDKSGSLFVDCIKFD
jgi:dTDP-4-dehydrorhamnose 3,5-epimerase